MPPPMTATSAAHTLATWIDQHGRVPALRECVASAGLPHYTTYYRLFGSLSAAICAAQTLHAQPPRPTPVGTRPCLRCTRPTPWEGAHRRLCAPCRKELHARPVVEVYGALPKTLRLHGGKTHIDLYEYFWDRDDWRSDIDWRDSALYDGEDGEDGDSLA